MPVSSSTMNRFKICRLSPLRLPPSGIYTYSRNQPDRVMCQRRQNSVMEAEI